MPHQVWLLAADDDAVLPFSIPLSIGGLDPHFPSDSDGSITFTDPSVNPIAIWLGSCGCAPTTSGYTDWLLQNITTQIQKHHSMIPKTCILVGQTLYAFQAYCDLLNLNVPTNIWSVNMITFDMLQYQQSNFRKIKENIISSAYKP